MRDHRTHHEADRDVAMRLLVEATKPVTRTETVSIRDSIGRILARDAVAQLDMPNCLTCCMDSVAVHWSDFEAGMPDTTGWQRGREWEFANTGIGMPIGYDTAIVIEHVILGENNETIAFDAAPAQKGAGTREAGSSMHAGDVLARKGEILTPLLASFIASGNNAAVEVYAKPVIAFIPTGNELRNVGTELPRGKNFETNSILTEGKLRSWGVEPKIWDIVPDDCALIREAIVEAARTCDAVILNAGSSKGSDDWNIEMLEEVGSVLYHQTNHGPGHHCSGGIVEGKPVIGISGPPAGAAFALDFYAYPVAMALQGLPPYMTKVQAHLTEAFPAKKPIPAKEGGTRPSIVEPKKKFYAIKQLTLTQDENGELWAVPSSSTHIGPRDANLQDCYYALDANCAPAAGDLIDVELRPEIGANRIGAGSTAKRDN